MRAKYYPTDDKGMWFNVRVTGKHYVGWELSEPEVQVAVEIIALNLCRYVSMSKLQGTLRTQQFFDAILADWVLAYPR